MNASRQSFIVSAVICILLAALFVARYRLVPYPVEAHFEGGMPLAALLARFAIVHPWPTTAAALFIAIWAMAVVAQLTLKYAPPANRNYLPAQLFLICAGGIVISGEALASLVAALLLTLASRQMIASLGKGYFFGRLFHAGFYLGFIPLLYAPAAMVTPVVAVAALTIYRRSGREAVVCLTGLLLPFAMATFIHWVLGDGGGFIWHELWRCAMEAPYPIRDNLPVAALVVAALVVIMALTGILWALGHRSYIRKKQFKFMQHTAVVLLATAVSSLLPGASTTLAAMIAVPVALSVPFSFSGKTIVVSSVLYFIILAAVLVLDSIPFLTLLAT